MTRCYKVTTDVVGAALERPVDIKAQPGSLTRFLGIPNSPLSHLVTSLNVIPEDVSHPINSIWKVHT